MRVLFISKEGDGLCVAQRLVLEGNEVDFWCADRRFDKAGIGIVNRVPSWQSAARRADLIIADAVGLARFEPAVRATNKPFLGFSKPLDTIELRRDIGMELFKRAGIEIPETHTWNSAREAAAIVKSQGFDQGWVIKPNGNQPAAQTGVFTDEALLARAISRLPPASNGILQRIVSGVEISTEGWFNGSDWIRPFNHTFEEKRFLAGGLGPNTGCMGNVVINAGAGDKLTKATIERVSDFLRAIKYRGPFDINCIVNAEGAFALEATSRMGYDAVQALFEGLDEPVGDFLFGVAEGSKKSMRLTENTMIAVSLSIPPWPNRKIDKDEAGEPVLGINEQALHHLFLGDLCREGDDYFTAGCEGKLLTATAIGRVSRGKRAPDGSTYKDDYTYEARRRVYRTLDRIKVPSKQYRVDIGERVNGDIAKLKEWKWL